MPPEGPTTPPPPPPGPGGDGRFREIVEGFADPLLMVDGEGLVRYANAALTRVLGHRLSDVLARPLEDHLDLEEAGEVLASVDGLIRPTMDV